jgi:hypothetical protein
MISSKKIIWIDDNPDRSSTAEDLGAVFINVRKRDLAPVVEKLLKGSRPRLVILDHILDKTTTTNPLFQRGSTIAEAIKEQWPSCPVIGVTNQDKIQDIDRRTKETYDDLFPFHDFGKYIPRIYKTRKDFAFIAKTDLRTVHRLVQVLRPPKQEAERLAAALPDDLKEAFRDPRSVVASRLYRWVDRLIDRPGFLYNSLWASTLLGLTELGFQKVAGRFEKGKYDGVFVRDDDARWWSSRLSDLLYKQCKPQSGEMSWHVGRRLRSIKKEHFSHCYACNEEFPDTVAYLDKVSDLQRAMHLKCTILHPRYQRELYFEDVRMMQGN